MRKPSGFPGWNTTTAGGASGGSTNEATSSAGKASRGSRATSASPPSSIFASGQRAGSRSHPTSRRSPGPAFAGRRAISRPFQRRTSDLSASAAPKFSSARESAARLSPARRTASPETQPEFSRGVPTRTHRSLPDARRSSTPPGGRSVKKTAATSSPPASAASTRPRRSAGARAGGGGTSARAARSRPGLNGRRGPSRSCREACAPGPSAPTNSRARSTAWSRRVLPSGSGAPMLAVLSRIRACREGGRAIPFTSGSATAAASRTSAARFSRSDAQWRRRLSAVRRSSSTRTRSQKRSVGTGRRRMRPR